MNTLLHFARTTLLPSFLGILREKIGDVALRSMGNGSHLCQHKGWPKDKPTNTKLIEEWQKENM